MLPERRKFLKTVFISGTSFITGFAISDILKRTKNPARNEDQKARNTDEISYRRKAEKILKNGKLNLAIIGTGSRGQLLEQILIKYYQQNINFVGFCDILPGRIRKANQIVGRDIPQFTDYRDVFNIKGLDAVIIATPNFLHKKMAVEALNERLHVFLEKPMAVTMEECHAIINASKLSNKICHIGFEFRFSPLYQKIKEIIEAGIIGKVKHIKAEILRGDWYRQFPKNPEKERKYNWRYYKNMSGGSLVEKLCHDFDIFTWIIGQEPVMVSATGGKAFYTDRETIDHANIVLLYNNGVKFQIDFSLFSPVRMKTMIFGTKGILEFDRDGSGINVIHGTCGKVKKTEKINIRNGDYKMTGHSGTRETLLAFLNSVINNKKLHIGPEQGTLAIKVSLAAHESVEQEGIPVSIN